MIWDSEREVWESPDPLFVREPDDAPDDDNEGVAWAMSSWDPRRKVWVPVPERRDA